MLGGFFPITYSTEATDLELVSILQEEIAGLPTTVDTYTKHPLPDLRSHPARRQGRGDLGLETPSAHLAGGVEALPRGGVDVEIHPARQVLLVIHLNWHIENGVAVSAEKGFQQR